MPDCPGCASTHRSIGTSAAGVWGITKYDDVKDMSRHPDVWSSAGGIRPDSGPTGHDDRAGRSGALATSPARQQGIHTTADTEPRKPRCAAIVDRLLDRWSTKGQCDFVTDVAAWLPLVMIGDALGFEEADHPTLLKWSRRPDARPGPGRSREAHLDDGGLRGLHAATWPVSSPTGGRARRRPHEHPGPRRGRRRSLRRRHARARDAVDPHRRRRDDTSRDHRWAVPADDATGEHWDALLADRSLLPVGHRGDVALGVADQEHGANGDT